MQHKLTICKTLLFFHIQLLLNYNHAESTVFTKKNAEKGLLSSFRDINC